MHGIRLAIARPSGKYQNNGIALRKKATKLEHIKTSHRLIDVCTDADSKTVNNSLLFKRSEWETNIFP